MSIKLATKTTVAAVLSLIIAEVLHWEYPFYAVIAAIIVMGLTSGSTFKLSLQRINGTLVGGLIGVLASLTLGNTPWSLGISVFLSISLASQWKLKEAAKVSGYVAAITVLTHSQQPLLYGWGRFLETLLGVGVALLVNRFFWRTNAEVELRQVLSQILVALEELYQQIITCYFTGQCEEESVTLLKSKLISLLQESRELWSEVKKDQGSESSEIKINAAWEFLIRRLWEHSLMIDHSALVKRRYQDTFWQRLIPELQQLAKATSAALQQLAIALKTGKHCVAIPDLEAALTAATEQLDHLQNSEQASYSTDELLRFFTFFYTLEEIGRKVLRMAENTNS
jgi:uncharacterized membrane protein YccC